MESVNTKGGPVAEKLAPLLDLMEQLNPAPEGTEWELAINREYHGVSGRWGCRFFLQKTV